MRQEIHIATSVTRWVARLWSLASLALIALLAVGTGGFPDLRDVIGLGLFPIGVAVGFVIAWWREGLGGALSVASLVGFYIWHVVESGRLPQGPYFLLLSAPGILFLLVAFLASRRLNSCCHT